MSTRHQISRGEIKAAENKYYHDRGQIMDMFKLSRTRWYVRRYGSHVIAESDLGNQIWAKTLHELQDVLSNAGVDPRDIKINLEEFK